MRIGINLLYLIPGKVGGTETYARELIPAMIKQLDPDDQLIIFCGLETAPTLTNLPQSQIVTLPISSENRALRIIAEQTILPYLCVTHQVEVLFSLGYSAPLIHVCPSVVTIHDLNWYYYPEDFGRFNRFLWEWLTRLSAAVSDSVITDSTASAESLIKVLSVPRNKITAILHGTPHCVVAKLANIHNPYLLTVVAGYPHKNLSTLLKSFAQVVRSYPKLKLIVCGLGGKADHINGQLITELDLQNKVKIMGYVSREVLAGLYRCAKIFVYPSAYEGFGYPVLEAMSYGVPIVSSNAFSLSEVVGKGGILVKPYDINAYTRAISAILESKKLDQDLVKRGKERVGELKWETTAGETLAILRKLATI